MGWAEFYDKLQRHSDSYFVFCEDDNERNRLRTLLREEFPLLTETEIDSAIARCCDRLVPPRSRKRFFEYLSRELGI